MTDAELIAWILGEATAEESERVRIAESSDPTIAGRVARLRRMIEDLRAVGEEQEVYRVSLTQRTALVKLFPCETAGGVAAGGTGTFGAIRELVASLIFDSGAGMAAAAGFRGATRDRHVVYAVDGVEVDVRVIRPLGEDGHRVAGLVAGIAGVEEVVAIGPGGDEERRAAVDETGYFEMTLAGPRVMLELRGKGVVVVLPVMRVDEAS